MVTKQNCESFVQILLFTEDETVPQSFCSGDDFPITCRQYAASEAGVVAEYLQSRTFSALFSPGDHQGHVKWSYETCVAYFF